MKNKIEERVKGHHPISECPFFIPKIHVEIKLKILEILKKGRQAYEIPITHPQTSITQQAKAIISRFVYSTNLFTHQSNHHPRRRPCASNSR